MYTYVHTSFVDILPSSGGMNIPFNFWMSNLPPSSGCCCRSREKIVLVKAIIFKCLTAETRWLYYTTIVFSFYLLV